MFRSEVLVSGRVVYHQCWLIIETPHELPYFLISRSLHCSLGFCGHNPQWKKPMAGGCNKNLWGRLNGETTFTIKMCNYINVGKYTKLVPWIRHGQNLWEIFAAPTSQLFFDSQSERTVFNSQSTTLWFWGFWGSLAPHLVGKYIIPGDHYRSPNITG